MTSSRQRILYPAGNVTSNRNLTVDHNVTVDCIEDCIGVCVYSICFPSTPISPTPLPYGDVSGNETTPINLHGRNRVLPTLIITATAAVVGSFFLLLAFYAYLRLRHGRRRRRRILATGGEAAIIEDDDDLVQGGEEVEHHIWYIRTQGLDENTISSIPSVVYRSGDGLVDGRDCSVCLGDFRDGELTRLLPTCRHAFHLPCIDRWLRSHVNCPLCRSPIVPPVDTPVSEPSFISPNNTVNSGQVWTENGPSVLAENTEIETLTCEGNTQGKDIITEIQLSEGSSSRASTSELPHSSPRDEESLQPIRRSVSMDSFPLDDPVKGGRKEGEFVQQQGNEYASENGEKSMGYLKDNLILELKYPAQMERSLSSQSARWFFTRYGRSRNTVLPL